MKERSVIGIDFGTQSARAVVCRTRDGAVLGAHECTYAHGVMTSALPCGTPLPPDYALQHPQDYLDALTACVRGALAQSGAAAGDIIGLGMDFTCTVIPLGKGGAPLCFDKRFADHPHAWIKLWKHHGAQREAEELTALLAEKDPQMLAFYGGRISSECFFAKMLETMRQDPAAFAAADRFTEVGDWLTHYLTGSENRSASMAAFKAFWRAGVGYPPCLMAAQPALRACVGNKLRGEMIAPARAIGYLTPDKALLLGLPAGIPVAASSFDGHAALPASGIGDENAALLSLGTSSCVIAAYPAFRAVKSVCSMAEDGILPGYFAYASGQAGFGDTLDWFTRACVPADIAAAAKAAGVSLHAELSRRAALLRPGQSGLLALDWWNGSKPLADTSLSGLLLGQTLQTKPEEIYRALLESLVFGTRYLLDCFARQGIRPQALHLGGGIAFKNPFFVQLIADITRMPLLATKPLATPAVGMAIAAATCAGAYDTLFEAIRHMHCLSGERFTPREEIARAYDPLYQEYLTLSCYFNEENAVMHRLRALAASARKG